MLKMAVGHTDELDGELAAAEIIEQCNAALNGLTPQAGLLLASHDVDLEDFLGLIRAAFPNIELIGCTTLAPMSSAADFIEGSTTLTLFSSDVVEFTAGLGRGVAGDVDRAATDAVAEARAKTDQNPALCIATPSVEGIDPTYVIDALGSVLGPETPLFGGGAVPDLPMMTPWEGSSQFYGDEIVTDAMPILLISGPLKVSMGVDHGWRGVGRDAVVTRAKGDLVYEVDNEPVLEFYKHYTGGSEPALTNPLAVFDEESQRHYLRAPMDHDHAEGAVTFLGTVPEGAKVNISMATTDQILEGTVSSLREAIAGYPESFRPEGALIASCATRNLLLGSQTPEELLRIREGLGMDIPVAGFYAFGEISPLGKSSGPRFHNETCVTVLFGT
jgi:hypothetical protein